MPSDFNFTKVLTSQNEKKYVVQRCEHNTLCFTLLESFSFINIDTLMEMLHFDLGLSQEVTVDILNDFEELFQYRTFWKTELIENVRFLFKF